MTDKQTPPDWVLLEAAKLSSWDVYFAADLRSYYRDGLPMHDGYRALCDMIEKYEQPPVDRKVLCAREAWEQWDGEDYFILCVRAIELWEEGFGK